MHPLLEEALNAHGGIETWRRFTELSINAVNDGALWGIKYQVGYAKKPVKLTFDLQREKSCHTSFVDPGVTTEVTPDRVRIYAPDGTIVEDKVAPRQTFDGHTLQTPWDRAQLAYFSGYAMWSYLTTPFLLAWPDFEIQDAPSWIEDGEEWKGIKVTFPETLAYHSKEQIYYFDGSGLLRRHDYDVDIAKGARGAHYMYDYQTVQGLKFPLHHVVRIPGADNKPMPEPIVVDIQISAIALK